MYFILYKTQTFWNLSHIKLMSAMVRNECYRTQCVNGYEIPIPHSAKEPMSRCLFPQNHEPPLQLMIVRYVMGSNLKSYHSNRFPILIPKKIDDTLSYNYGATSEMIDAWRRMYVHLPTTYLLNIDWCVMVMAVWCFKHRKLVPTYRQLTVA